jgi:hypothetical protein
MASGGEPCTIIWPVVHSGKWPGGKKFYDFSQFLRFFLLFSAKTRKHRVRAREKQENKGNLYHN